jgi:hypothetical protein
LFCGGCNSTSRGRPFSTSSGDQSSHITLYSWQIAGGKYRFVLIPESEQERFVRKFNRNQKYIEGVGELESKLLALPRSTIVAWRTREEQRLVYPPPQMVHQIQDFAERHGIAFEVIPTVYE